MAKEYLQTIKNRINGCLFPETERWCWKTNTSSRTKYQTVIDKVREGMSRTIRRIHENCRSREIEVIDSFW